MSDLLASLRNHGAPQFDPVRFHYLETLAQRLRDASDAVRPILQDKLQAAVADYNAGFMQAQKAASTEVERLSALHPGQARELRRLFTAGDYPGVYRLGAQLAASRPQTPLAALNQYIQGAVQDGTNVDLRSGAEAVSEMKSVQRFREVWSKIAADQQVDQALVRGPENAGPLNSHMLVLRSLALMRSLSPDYLRRFLSHADSLLWLDQAQQKSMQVEAKPVARRSRAKK